MVRFQPDPLPPDHNGNTTTRVDGSSSSATHLINNYSSAAAPAASSAAIPPSDRITRLVNSTSSSSLLGTLQLPSNGQEAHNMDAAGAGASGVVYSSSSPVSPPVLPLSAKEFVVRELSAVILWMVVALGTLLFLSTFVLASNNNNWLIVWSFYNPLVLVWIQQKTGVLPLWQIRVTEWRMGRLETQEMVLAMGVHLLVGTAVLLYLPPLFVAFLSDGVGGGDVSISPSSNLNNQVTAILEFLQGATASTTTQQYLEETPSLLASALSDMLTTACFLVSLLVLPVLLDLNHHPRWILLVILYPFFRTAGSPSSSVSSSSHPHPALTLMLLSPNVLIRAWTTMMTRSYCFVVQRRLVAQFIGALLAGEVVDFYFPDDPKT